MYKRFKLIIIDGEEFVFDTIRQIKINHQFLNFYADMSIEKFIDKLNELYEEYESLKDNTLRS